MSGFTNTACIETVVIPSPESFRGEGPHIALDASMNRITCNPREVDIVQGCLCDFFANCVVPLRPLADRDDKN